MAERVDAGLWLDDLAVGDRLEHAAGRTVTAFDNTFVSLLTHNQNPIHVDWHASRTSVYGEPLIESVITLGICVGLGTADIGRHSLGDLGYSAIRHLAPVFAGDTLTASSEVVAVEPSGVGPPGRVTIHTVGHKQDGTDVIAFDRTLLVAHPVRPDDSTSTQHKPGQAGPVQTSTDKRENALMAEHRRFFGRTLEDFVVGDVYRHWPGRTVTEFDDTWFSLLTMNQHPVHIDAAYAETTQHGQRLVNGLFVLATAVGMSVPDVSGKAIANLEYESVAHHAPTFHGDTIYASTTVLEARPSDSKPDRGVVYVETQVHNQKTELIMTFRRRVLVPTCGPE